MSNYQFTCRYCGFSTNNSRLVNGCTKSPTRNHVWISARDEYVCKYCGFKTKNPRLVSGCTKNPNAKTHEWME